MSHPALAQQGLFSLGGRMRRILTMEGLAMTALFLLVTIPFFNWVRFQPSGDYVSSVCAVLLAMAVVVLSPTRNRDAETDGALLLLVLLPLLTLVTSLVSPYPGQGLAASVGVLLCLALAHAISRHPPQLVLTTLAWGLLLGGLLQVLVGLLQLTQWVLVLRWAWVFYDKSNPANLFGQLAQRNLYANYLTLSLFAGCYLFAVGKLRGWLLPPLVLVFGLFISWSGSRVAIGYAGAALLLVWLFFWRGGRQSSTGRLAAALTLATCWLLFCQLFSKELVALLSWLGLPLGNVGSGAERMRMLSGGFNTRWVEWQKAWQVFLAHPLFGVGLGSYAAESVRLEAAMGFAGQWSGSKLFTHSHNLILQLLAETGLFGTAVVVVGLCWAFLPFFRKEQANVHSLLVVLLAMVLLLHSMVEYPLWYMTFLSLFAVLLGLSPARRYTLAIRPSMRRVLTWGFCALLLWQSVAGLQAYGKLASWYMPGSNAQVNVMRAEEVWHITRNPLWTYEADMVLANYLVVDKQQLQEKRALFERLTAYRPHAGMLINVAILRALDGDSAAAKQALRLAIAAYPAYTPGFAAELMSRRDPELQPLQVIANAALQARRNGGAQSAAAGVLVAPRR
ncbi:PglL family O-oligosaccharyltransferase [Vogesella indigofera]|uniref:PglL family O-oligosaccharyltransferase n=1 Tax=Vogesella indigofera TaxID=45465 RepID=UPI00234F81CE|nr:O-antigen ligase family protein [Vogesella indigofera]MDC7709005.1 Wzy polymerase domain-containing protein [Vogesella indigofera]